MLSIDDLEKSLGDSNSVSNCDSQSNTSVLVTNPENTRYTNKADEYIDEKITGVQKISEESS